MYDSTNIISSDYVVLTSLSYDHQQLLGTTLPAILQQKLGIIKTTTKKVFVSKTIAVFLQKIIIRTILNQELIFSNCNTKNYLTNNLDLAFVITKHLLPHVTSSKLKLTLKKTKNRLRFQKIVFANKVLYFDVAHNNAGVKAVKMLLDYQKINVDKVIFSCLIDKNKTLLLKTLRKITNNIVICRNSHFRSIDGAEFNFNEMIKEDKKNMIFLIIGSCYFVADVYNKFITYSKKV